MSLIGGGGGPKGRVVEWCITLRKKKETTMSQMTSLEKALKA